MRLRMEGNASRQTRQSRHATRRQPPGEALPHCNFTRPAIAKAPTGGTGPLHRNASQRNTTLHIPPLTPLLHQQQENELAHTCPPPPEIGTLKNSRVSQPSHVPEWSFRLVEAWNPPGGGEIIVAWSWVQISCPALSLSTQGSKPSLSPICNYCTSVQVYILVHQLQVSTTAQRRWKGDNRFRRIISAPPRRSSLASRTRNPRFEAKNSIEPCFRCPSLHTALRGGRGSPIKFQMPVKLHPGVEVHSDAKTATLALSGTILEWDP